MPLRPIDNVLTGISVALITGLLPQVLEFIAGTGGIWKAPVERLSVVPFLQDIQQNKVTNANSVFAGSWFILRFGLCSFY
jgi:hypothetical protein